MPEFDMTDNTEARDKNLRILIQAREDISEARPNPAAVSAFELLDKMLTEHGHPMRYKHSATVDITLRCTEDQDPYDKLREMIDKLGDDVADWRLRTLGPDLSKRSEKADHPPAEEETQAADVSEPEAAELPDPREAKVIEHAKNENWTLAASMLASIYAKTGEHPQFPRQAFDMAEREEQQPPYWVWAASQVAASL